MDLFQENYTDHSDDNSYDLVNRSDHSSDESYEFVGSEELYDRTTDFEEHPSAESETQRNGAEPSGSGTDVLDKGYKNTDDSSSGNEDSDIETEDTFGYHPAVQGVMAYEYEIFFEFPKHIRRREDMSLSDVVEEHALRFLPAKSLCRFKAVSREWGKQIARPIFPYVQSMSFRSTSGYFSKYLYYPQFISLNGPACGIPDPSLTFLPDLVDIKSSCNGLLLCQGSNGKYYVCNPVTKEWDVLPQPNFYHGEAPRAVLAFDPSEDRNFETSYQVICPYTELNDPITYFEIYHSVTKTWESLNAGSIELGDSELNDNGFYANGVSYWETSDRVLLAFDMKEKFCLVQEFPLDEIWGGTMSYFDGEICYISAYIETGNTCVININGGLGMKSKGPFNVEVPLELRGAARGRCLVLPCVNGDCLSCVIGNGAFAFYPKDQSVIVMRGVGIDFASDFIPYVNSLVPLSPKSK